ncbi:unnamed protein product [Calicophoron daubneyi]
MSNLEEDRCIDLLIDSILDIMLLVVGEDGPMCYCWAHWSEPDDSSDEARTEPESGTEKFFQGLKFIHITSQDELHGVIMSLTPQLQSSYGVLCFLYSVLFTHGMLALRKGMGDESETLIDPTHGHASQSLINLLLTGQMTPNLFDGVRSISDYSLTGILKQPKTGFLTLFEALHYCEAGWYLKNPSYPIWVLGSETHLTVLASPQPELVSDESSHTDQKATLHQAELEFARLSVGQDPDTGFIQSERLAELLQNLQISYTDQSLNGVKQKLDPEDLGVILKEPFLLHFFPKEMSKRCSQISNFKLIHYNGLQKSNPNGQVRYQTGEARILDPTEELAEIGTGDISPIQRCLQTKWPTIRIKWENDQTPSLN